MCWSVCRSWRLVFRSIQEEHPLPQGYHPGGMREVVQIQIGQCGNQIGNQFWEAIALEHGLDVSGSHNGSSRLLDQINVYFHETCRAQYIPRAILSDLDPCTLDSTRSGALGRLFKPDSFVIGQTGAGNNFAKGYYTAGAELMEPLMDRVRREAEQCDSLQGFQVCHSLGGGTGSGMGSQLIDQLSDQYPGDVVCAFSVVPSPNVCDTVVEPYNAILAGTHLAECADMCVCLDNEALYHCCYQTLKLSNPNYGDLNHLIATCMSGVTCTFRFPSWDGLSDNLRKLATNLIPYRGLNFLLTSIAPMTVRDRKPCRELTTPEIHQQMFDARSMLCAVDPRHGRFLTQQTVDRGRVGRKEVDEQVFNVSNTNSSYWVEWIPNNIKSTVCEVPPYGGPARAGTMIGNSTAIREIWMRLSEQFGSLYRRRAFIHWYTSEGMDEMEFTKAEFSMNELVDEYQLWQDATAWDSDDEEDVYDEM